MSIIDVILVYSVFPFSAKDEEDTIDDQEKVEGDVNHAEELDDLAREGTWHEIAMGVAHVE